MPVSQHIQHVKGGEMDVSGIAFHFDKTGKTG